MKKPADEQGLMSRLPRDPEYWDGLTDRIMTAVGSELAGRHTVSAWSQLGRFSTALATTAAAAVVAAVFFMPQDAAVPETATPSSAYLLAPADPLAESLLAAETPPPIHIMTALSTLEAGR